MPNPSSTSSIVPTTITWTIRFMPSLALLVNDLAADNGCDDGRLADVVPLRLRQDVARQHDKVGELAARQRAAIAVLERRVSARERVRLDRLRRRDLLLGEPA